MKRTKFIFDLDGTLYQYKGGSTFNESNFYRDIKQNIFSYLQSELLIPTKHVAAEYQRLKMEHHGHVSIAIEKEFGIDRSVYFSKTWNMQPDQYIDKNPSVLRILSQLSGRCAVLTEAPRIWADAALEYLNVSEYVEDMIFTGEPDIRKPSVEIFKQVGDALGGNVKNYYSVGDQEQSDVLFAREAGMKTIRIGGLTTAADYHIQKLSELEDLGLI